MYSSSKNVGLLSFSDLPRGSARSDGEEASRRTTCPGSVLLSREVVVKTRLLSLHPPGDPLRKSDDRRGHTCVEVQTKAVDGGACVDQTIGNGDTRGLASKEMTKERAIFDVGGHQGGHQARGLWAGATVERHAASSTIIET